MRLDRNGSSPAAVPPAQLVGWASRVAGMATCGWVTEDHAVEFLADAAARDTGILTEAALQSQNDPDAVPLAFALLSRAVTASRRPLITRRTTFPQAPGP